MNGDVVGKAGLVRFKGHKDAVTDLVRPCRLFPCSCLVESGMWWGRPGWCGCYMPRVQRQLGFSANAALLASGSADTSIIAWDVVGEAGLVRFKGHKDAVTDLVGGSTSESAASGCMQQRQGAA
jgi:WD40 repeat protein